MGSCGSGGVDLGAIVYVGDAIFGRFRVRGVCRTKHLCQMEEVMEEAMEETLYIQISQRHFGFPPSPPVRMSCFSDKPPIKRWCSELRGCYQVVSLVLQRLPLL
jgi:hypothetical protein